MKKLRVIMRVVGVLLVGVMMYSCSEPAVDEISLNYETTEWGSSLNRVICVLENKPLSIESYRYLGDITNDSERESLLDDIFDNNEYMLVYIGEDCVNYEIMTYGESIKKLNTKNKDLYLPRRNLVTSQIANHNIGVVELNWDYKGNKFKTKMIVSTDGEKGFLYDNILSYLPAENQPEKSSIAKNTYRVNGKVVKEEVIELPKMNHAEVGVAKTTYRVNGKVVKEEIEDLKTLTNQK